MSESPEHRWPEEEFMATACHMDEEMGDSPKTPEHGRSEVDTDCLRRMSIHQESPRSRSTVMQRRKLFPKDKRTQYPWSVEEIKTLVLFLMLHSDGQSWMTHKDFYFWSEAGSFIQLQVHTSYKRSGIIATTLL